ncbi:unnamed protein product [Trichobilharzia regenti]|nr:unnamed protein product [Trichobilharzia regenti]
MCACGTNELFSLLNSILNSFGEYLDLSALPHVGMLAPCSDASTIASLTTGTISDSSNTTVNSNKSITSNTNIDSCTSSSPNTANSITNTDKIIIYDGTSNITTNTDTNNTTTFNASTSNISTTTTTPNNNNSITTNPSECTNYCL